MWELQWPFPPQTLWVGVASSGLQPPFSVKNSTLRGRWLHLSDSQFLDFSDAECQWHVLRGRKELQGCGSVGGAYKRTEIYSWGEWKSRDGRIRGEGGKARSHTDKFLQDSLGKRIQIHWDMQERLRIRQMGKDHFKMFLLGAVNWVPLAFFRVPDEY